MRGVCESERERERGWGSWDCCWDATDLMSLIAWACRVPLLSERDLQFFRAVKTNLLCDPLVKSVLAVGCMFALQYFTSEQLAQSLNSLYRPVVAVHCLIFCLNSYRSFFWSQRTVEMIGYMPAGTWLTVTKPGPKSAQLFTALKEVDGVCWTRIELVPGGSRHITPDSKTRLREQWRAKEEEMRLRSVWSLAAKHLRQSSACLLPSGVERRPCRAEGEPSCAGPRHVEEAVGSKERWGKTPHTLNTTLWKRNWQPQINSNFSLNHLFI